MGLLASLVPLLLGAPACQAIPNPPGCLGLGLGISLTTDTPGVSIGSTIRYSVCVFNAPFPACDAGSTNPADAGAIRARVITPDGATNHLALAQTFLAPGDSDCYAHALSYVVRAQDVLPDGTLRASAFVSSDITTNNVVTITTNPTPRISFTTLDSASQAVVDRFDMGTDFDGLAYAPEDHGYGATVFYTLRKDPAGISYFDTVTAATASTVDRFDAGSRSFDALAYASPDLGYGPLLFYYLSHDSAGVSTFGSITPGGSVGVTSDLFVVGSRFDALTFAATDLGYGANLFYYVRHDATGLSTFGTINPAQPGTVTDRFAVGTNVDAMVFTDQALPGYGANQFFYLRHDAEGVSTFGTIFITGLATATVTDRFTVGTHVTELTYTATDTGFGANLFYLLRGGAPSLTTNMALVFTTNTMTTFSTNTVLNHAPSLTLGENPLLIANAGLQILPGWASAFSPGPAHESSQALSVAVTNNNPSFFSVQPSLTLDGTLTFQSAATNDDTALVTVTLRDNGGTNYGGLDVSMHSFIISISGHYGSSYIQPVGNATVVLLLNDFDNDGVIDLATLSNHENLVCVLRGMGDGTFRRPFNIPVGRNPVSLKIIDGNRDGNRDILVVNQDDNTVSLLLGRGDGTLYMNQTAAVGDRPVHVADTDNVDFDGNGTQDFVVLNAGSKSISVFLGSGHGYFHPAWPPTMALTHTPSFAFIQDYNNDGKMDLAIANGDNASVSILFGRGNGTFTAPADTYTFGVGSQPVSLWAKDLNKDGWMDLAVANEGSDTVSILTGSGAGLFTQTATYPVGRQPRSVFVSPDMNGDNCYDLAVANHGSGTVSVLLGNTNGTFQPGRNYRVGPAPTEVYVRNLNAGTRPDIVTAHDPGPFVTVLLDNAPIARDQAVTLLEDTSKVIELVAFQGARALDFMIIEPPTNGALLGSGSIITYRPNPNYFGPDTFVFRAADRTLSATGRVSIHVQPVNDPPSFELSTHLLAARTYTLTYVTNFIWPFSAGPSNEKQSVKFLVHVSRPELFITQPSINPAGRLQFRAVTGVSGSTTVSVQIEDSGGILQGGSNRAPVQIFTLSIPENPFTSTAVQGTYYGLFQETDATRHGRSGYVNLSVNGLGTMTGRILLEGGIHALSGSFDLTGAYQKRVLRPGKNPLSLQFQLDISTHHTSQVTGTVSDGNWTAPLLGDLASYGRPLKRMK